MHRDAARKTLEDILKSESIHFCGDCQMQDKCSGLILSDAQGMSFPSFSYPPSCHKQQVLRGIIDRGYEFEKYISLIEATSTHRVLKSYI